jgi:hypothetical protein
MAERRFTAFLGAQSLVSRPNSAIQQGVAIELQRKNADPHHRKSLARLNLSIIFLAPPAATLAHHFATEF